MLASTFYISTFIVYLDVSTFTSFFKFGPFHPLPYQLHWPLALCTFIQQIFINCMVCIRSILGSEDTEMSEARSLPHLLETYIHYYISLLGLP